MPIVAITMIEGRSDKQKHDMFREVTDAIHRTTGAPVDSVRIMIHEVPARHFATAGVPKSGPSSSAPSAAASQGGKEGSSH